VARILVADDDDDMRLVLQIALEQQGHVVTQVDNGTDALEVCLSGDIEVAMLDVTMPGLEGPEVVARVRADPDRKGLPILLLSANSTIEDIDRGLEAGADDYLTKPWQTFELQRRIERMVWLAQPELVEIADERVQIRSRARAALDRLRGS
jgi:DNA-binding response OmpR family regulator